MIPVCKGGQTMSSPSAERKVYRFSVFEVDTYAGEVRKRGVRVRVQEQPFRLLTALLEHPGELITREDLHQRLWQDQTFVDFEHGLNAAVTRLRQALGDSAQNPRFIENLPRRGYRFIAPVETGPVALQSGLESEASLRPSIDGSLNADPAEEPVPLRRSISKRTLYWLAPAALLIAIAVFVVVHLRDRRKQDQLVKFALVPPGATRFGIFDTAAVSPDGHRIAFTATDDSGETQLWERPLDAVESHRLDGTEGAEFPFWSPDSRAIAFFANGKLKRIEADRGAPSTICDAPNGRGGSWNRAGTILFSPSPDSVLFQVPSAGGQARPVTDLDKSRGEFSHRWPSFLPDGRHFVYSIHNGQPEKSGVYAGVLDSKQRTLLVPGESNASYAGGQATGYLVFARGSTLFSQPLDPEGLTLSGEPQPIAEYVTHAHHIEPLYGKFSLSGNGVLLYESARATDELTWFDRTGKRLGTLGEAGVHLTPSLSPNEAEVAIEQIGPHKGTFSLFRTAHGTVSRLTNDPHDEVAPVWSPDGNRIAFASGRGDSFDLYQKSSFGVGAEEVLLKSAQWKFPTDWSPDGRFLIYYEINPGRNRDLWVLPMAQGAKAVPLCRHHSTKHSVSFLQTESGLPIAPINQENRRSMCKHFLLFPEAAFGWFPLAAAGRIPNGPEAGKHCSTWPQITPSCR